MLAIFPSEMFKDLFALHLVLCSVYPSHCFVQPPEVIQGDSDAAGTCPSQQVINDVTESISIEYHTEDRVLAPRMWRAKMVSCIVDYNCDATSPWVIQTVAEAGNTTACARLSECDIFSWRSELQHSVCKD